jgi:uncharacterized protein YgiM (DUF1202 family)
MKKTLLYLAVLCFTAAFSQKISDFISNSFEPKTIDPLENYSTYKRYRANLEKKKQAERKLYTYAIATRLKNYKFGDYLIVTSKAADIRTGAGTDFKTIQTIKQDGLLKFNSYQGHWIKVTVVETGKAGYIHFKDVK